MSGFHCVMLPRGDVGSLSDALWPRTFPPRGTGWVQSTCGRVALRLGDENLVDRVQQSYSDIIGEASDPDIALELSHGQLRITRGHVGRMAVFYFQARDFILITNRLPDLLGSVECGINFGSALHYLSFGTPLPGNTLIDGVRALPAGHSLKLEPGIAPVCERDFDLLRHAEPTHPSQNEVSGIIRAVDAAIARSAKGGDVALLLSAGIDSSYIATLLGDRVQACYTSYFPDLKTRGEFDEARRYSRIIGREHEAVPVEIGDARRSLEVVLEAEEPRSAWSTIVHEEICRAVSSRGHRTLLSGLGADEVFGGYFHYARSFRSVWRQALRLDPTSTRNPLELLLGSPQWYRGRLFTGIPLFFKATALRQALRAPWREWDQYQSSVHFYLDALARKPDAHLFEAMIAHEAQHRVPDLLIRGFEASSYKYALRTEFPFLDRVVMRKAAALGADLRFARDRSSGTTRNKLLWRDIAAKRLPEFVMSRPPSAYDAPINSWLSDRAFRDTICDAISLSSFADLGLFSRAWISGFVDEMKRSYGGPEEGRRSDLAEQAWILATFAAWQDRMLDIR